MLLDSPVGMALPLGWEVGIPLWVEEEWIPGLMAQGCTLEEGLGVELSAGSGLHAEGRNFQSQFLTSPYLHLKHLQKKDID